MKIFRNMLWLFVDSLVWLKDKTGLTDGFFAHRARKKQDYIYPPARETNCIILPDGQMVMPGIVMPRDNKPANFRG